MQRRGAPPCGVSEETPGSLFRLFRLSLQKHQVTVLLGQTQEGGLIFFFSFVCLSFLFTNACFPICSANPLKVEVIPNVSCRSLDNAEYKI